MTGLRGGTVLPRSETARGGMVPGLSAFPLRELVGWGGLERQGDGSYRLGRRLWLLGTAAPCVHRIHQAAVEALHELRTVTGLGAQLAVLDGTEAVVLAAFGRSAGADGGDRLPLYASAVGKMLLAHASPRVLEAVVQGGLTRRRRTRSTLLGGWPSNRGRPGGPGSLRRTRSCGSAAPRWPSR